VLKANISHAKSVFLEKVYIGHLPEIKNNFKIQIQIFDAENYKLIYKNPESDIEAMKAGDNIYVKMEEPVFLS